MQGPFHLRAQPLTVEAFRPYGDVIEATHEAASPIQSGTALRFDDLIDVAVGSDGKVSVNLLKTTDTASFPHRPAFLECHPLGSQAFIPLSPAAFVVIAGRPGNEPALDSLRAFITDGAQGVNYKPGVWHLPITALSPATFLMIERKGPGLNLRKHPIPDAALVVDLCEISG